MTAAVTHVVVKVMCLWKYTFGQIYVIYRRHEDVRDLQMLWVPKECNYTKYYDRSCIAEVLRIDEQISSKIFRKDDLNEIKVHLNQSGFKSMLDDGMQKVKMNITSKEEVYKVITY